MNLSEPLRDFIRSPDEVLKAFSALKLAELEAETSKRDVNPMALLWLVAAADALAWALGHEDERIEAVLVLLADATAEELIGYAEAIAQDIRNAAAERPSVN